MMNMTFDEWLKSPGRHERLVKIEIQPGVEVEAVCRVNSKREFFAKLERFSVNNESAWEIFSAEWLNPLDHSLRMFSGAADLGDKLSPEMVDKFVEAWTLANTGKSAAGELNAPGVISPEPRSVSRGGYSARRSASGISTIWKRWFRSRR